MASRAPAKGNAAKGNEHWRIVLKRSLLRAGQMTGAILLGLLAVFVALALLGYHESDPSMNTAAGGAVENVMGTPGAWVAGLLLWLGGIGTVLLLKIDKAALERNARLLETVLDDFNVKGEITAVRPGPVVTMYELEPAPGIKASRVIQLADDIARNMSAISARVATIPGRTVMGIELPNAEARGRVVQGTGRQRGLRGPEGRSCPSSWARTSPASR
jgi:hypothetical protein